MKVVRAALVPLLCACAATGLAGVAKCAAPGATGPYHIPRGFSADIVTVECDDGYKLAADWIRRGRMTRKMPGVIYLHQAGRDRHSWYPLTIQTAGRGMAVLALDLRGHGENPAAAGNPSTKAAGLGPDDYKKMVADVRNAVSYLAIRNEVDGGRIALVGSGLGANLALLTAGESWAEAVTCVIAVSPTLDDHGLAPLEAVKRIPKSRAVYLAAARDDAASWTACETLVPQIKTLKEFFQVETGGAGVALFGKGLFQKIPAWLYDAVLQPSLAAQGAAAPVRGRP